MRCVWTDLSVVVNGETLLLDRSGAAWWPRVSTLIVADLHFEKGSSFARFGQFLPPYDTRATLAVLAELLEAYKPRRVVCLGDSFHDGEAAERFHGDDARQLTSLTALRDWIWICGNHDPEPPARYGGRVMHEHTNGPLLFRHEAKHGATRGEISGHFHPKFGASVRGRKAQRSAISTVAESASGRSANRAAISARLLNRCSVES